MACYCEPVLAVLASSSGVAVDTELAYFSCKPKQEKLVYFQKDTKRTGGNCSGEAIEPFTGFLVKG